ncbi:hypothetical protein ACLKA6_018559 [Drosophila palustris]
MCGPQRYRVKSWTCFSTCTQTCTLDLYLFQVCSLPEIEPAPPLTVSCPYPCPQLAIVAHAIFKLQFHPFVLLKFQCIDMANGHGIDQSHSQKP